MIDYQEEDSFERRVKGAHNEWNILRKVRLDITPDSNELCASGIDRLFKEEVCSRSCAEIN